MADEFTPPPVRFYAMRLEDNRVQIGASNIEDPPPEWIEIDQATFDDYRSRPEELPYLIWQNGQVVVDMPEDTGPTVTTISQRQFYQGLAEQNIITDDEAIAVMAAGTIPAALETMVQGLPAENQFSARMLLIGATIYEISHPLTQTFQAAYGWSDQQVKDFFAFASTL